MKKIVLFLFIVLTFLTACRNDPVRDDLLNYLNDMNPYFKEWKRLSEAQLNATGDKHLNIEDKHRAMDEAEVVPGFKKYSEKINKIRPKTKEVRELHELHIRAVDLQYKFMNLLFLSLDDQDNKLLTEATEKLIEAQKYIEDYEIKLYDMAEDHGIKIERK
ncbi:hypothetical protein [Cohnella mopanensis]|uniref:hypothetical protein n=1 Tax=Cohnella mopanensis TaxID=2911966 RepID=UPI001EF85AF9|nr:hypothetical protein [Cohnella mopanensis]